MPHRTEQRWRPTTACNRKLNIFEMNFVIMATQVVSVVAIRWQWVGSRRRHSTFPLFVANAVRCLTKCIVAYILSMMFVVREAHRVQPCTQWMERENRNAEKFPKECEKNTEWIQQRQMNRSGKKRMQYPLSDCNSATIRFSDSFENLHDSYFSHICLMRATEPPHGRKWIHQSELKTMV